MEQRVSVITLGVADLARSRRFYEEGLGWIRTGEHDTVAFYQCNGFILSLFGRDALIADGQMDASQVGTGAIVLAHNVRARDEVDAVMAEAQRAGARVLKPAQPTFWGGYAGYFADPDGHPWEVAWNEGWPIDAAGHVTLGP